MLQVVNFCKDVEDIEGDFSNVHNKYAPNKHNRLCAMRSTWSVIKESTDFAIWSRNDTASIVETIPKFDVMISPRNRDYVLVLDDSGSMGGKVKSST